MKKNVNSILVFTFLIILGVEVHAGDKEIFRLSSKLTSQDYVPGKIIFKIKSQYRSGCGRTSVIIPSLNAKLALLQTQEILKLFPNHAEPLAAKNNLGQSLTDLSLIYEMQYNSGIPIEKAINLLLLDESVQYAEPQYTVQLLYTPNDTALVNQYQFTNVQAYAGWDISKGDSSIVIGITDTGTDLDHPDMAGNMQLNYADPVNGIDDDGDGYTDNYHGWDLGDNDNDPTVAALHGSFVAALATAVTDNVTGVAGAGFNTRYLPVKISSGSILNKAYEGIVYAADHGCQIINCSWGGFGGGQFGQDIIDYATINKNRLVIAASGNSNNDDSFFPASYKYVLSVTGTNAADEKWVASSYGSNVDVSAPGEAVYSAVADDTYAASSGTSFAAPIVAGLAGIVMWHMPSLTPLQVAEQIRATSDDIYSIPQNAPYINMLGKGRANLFRALTETNSKSVRMTDIAITDNNDNAFTANDTLSITGIITNWLANVNGLTLTLSCSSPDVFILDGVVNIASMNTQDVTDNNADPFLVRISPTVPLNSEVVFTISYADAGGYSDFQTFQLVLNVDYINVLINDVGTSITSRGRIGYNAPNASQGLGFTYNESSSVLYESCLLIGDSQVRVSDQMFGSPVGANDTDFTAVEYVRQEIPTVLSDFDLFSSFNDNGAGANALGVKVTQRTYAWSTPADAKYIMIYYTYKNEGAIVLNNFYAAIFADWDIGAVVNNRAAVDATIKLGYAYEDIPGGIYAGVKVLGSSPFNIYAFDNNGANGSFNIYDGLTKQEKFDAMSTPRSTAGTSGGGNDVSLMVASGPYSIAAGDSIKVGFALLAADSLTALVTAAQAADIKFDDITSISGSAYDNPSFNSVFPNPADKEVIIKFNIAENSKINIAVSDIAGKTIQAVNNGELNAGNHVYRFSSAGLQEGIYFVKIKMNEKIIVKKFVVYHK